MKMISLQKYFKDNKEKWGYYEMFSDNMLAESYETCDFFGNNYLEKYPNFQVYDEIAAIEKFRYLLTQSVASSISPEDGIFFLFLCFYLWKNDYTLKQFPEFLERPTELDEFSRSIRDYLFSIGKGRNGNMPYAERRLFASEGLEFIKIGGAVPIVETLNEMIEVITTRNARYTEMQIDEKLATILNIIENCLKQRGKYLQITDNDFFGLITNNDVVKYKKMLQCFRHYSEEAINERQLFTMSEKEFFENYGVTIINRFHTRN